MKDRFFKALDRLYVSIYRFVIKKVYTVIDKKRAKGCPRLSRDYKQKIHSYWSVYGIKPKYDDYRLYLARGVDPDPALISTEVWQSMVEPNQNALKYYEAFTDKNYFDLILGSENTPQTLVRCISGNFLDCNYHPISLNDARDIAQECERVIVKPTIDSGGGKSVRLDSGKVITDRALLSDCDNFDGNFCIQKPLVQHPFLSSFNPTSVQTIRVISFFHDGEVEILCASMRIGMKDSVVDNFCSGGFAINVDIGTGVLGEKLVDHEMRLFTRKEAGVPEGKLIVPYWNEAINLLITLHPRLSHFGLVSWDVTIREDGKPIVIEYNLIDSLVDWHQILVGPVLGNRAGELLPILTEPNPYI